MIPYEISKSIFEKCWSILAPESVSYTKGFFHFFFNMQAFAPIAKTLGKATETLASATLDQSSLEGFANGAQFAQENVLPALRYNTLLGPVAGGISLAASTAIQVAKKYCKKETAIALEQAKRSLDNNLIPAALMYSLFGYWGVAIVAAKKLIEVNS